MPTVLTYSTWQTRTAKIPGFKRTELLKAIDSSFQQYSSKSTPAKLDALTRDYEAWKESGLGPVKAERGQVVDVMLDMEHTLSTAVATPIVTGHEVRPEGWTLVAWTKLAYPWTDRLITDLAPDALSGSETSRINESIRRVLLAIELARDALLRIQRRNDWSVPLNQDEQRYVDFFGPHDATRFARVLRNFRVLHLTFLKKPRIVDVRNTKYGKTVYAACFRGDKGTTDQGGALSSTGPVEMFLGRSFFTAGSYQTSTDNTVGTLVHEFAHGAVNAVDAPRVLGGAWELAPNHLTNPAHPDYGESPQNHLQSSTPDLDRTLAAFAPDIPVRNADSYGQFAKESLLAAHG